MKAMNLLETERLRLRQLSLDDAAFILELLNQPSYVRFIGDRGVRTADDAERYIAQGPMESYRRFGFGLWMVEMKEGHLPVGLCGLIRREELDDIDIGFAFPPQFWGQGFATEAARAVMAYGRETLKLKRIVAIVSPDNERSIKLLEKLGLEFERLMKWPADGSELRVYATRG
jgi:RimJ/RimL family protein N-acetyltransferase